MTNKTGVRIFSVIERKGSDHESLEEIELKEKSFLVFEKAFQYMKDEMEKIIKEESLEIEIEHLNEDDGVYKIHTDEGEYVEMEIFETEISE